MGELRRAAEQVRKEIEAAQLDKARFSVAEKETQEFNMENGEFSLYRTLFDKELSVSVFHNQRTGASGTNRLDDEAIKETVASAVSSAESSVADEAYDIAPKQESQKFEVGVYEPDMDRLFERTKELAEDIKNQFPKIQVMQLIVSHEKHHELYWNTNGTEFERFAGAYHVMVEFSANDGENTTSIDETDFYMKDLEQPLIELAGMKRQFADTEKQLCVRPMEGKFEGTIVLTPGCLGGFLSAICRSFVSGNVVLEKTSIWLDKLERQVADPRITITFDPMQEGIVDYERYTRDGFVSEPFDLIRDGVLKSFLLPLYVANKSGMKPAKNLSRAVVMKAGDTPYEDMIKGIKKGLLLCGFSAGQPGTNGEISAVAKNSFLIEDGMVTDAVNEVMIAGNLAEMLNHVVAVSKETVSDGTSILPYLAVDGVVVSGKS